MPSTSPSSILTIISFPYFAYHDFVFDGAEFETAPLLALIIRAREAA